MNPQSGATLRAQLRMVDILAGLTDEQIRQIEPQIRIHHYDRGQMIFAFQDQAHDVFFLLKGEVRVTNYSRNGREIAFRDLNENTSFGELSAIDGKARSANVIALRRSTVASLSGSEYRACLRRYSSVLDVTLGKLVYLVRSLSERIADFAFLAEARVAAEVLRIAQQQTKDGKTARIAPRPSNGAIASRVNTQREQVSRTLTKLAKAGIVHRTTTELVVKDLRRLEEWVQQHEEE